MVKNQPRPIQNEKSPTQKSKPQKKQEPYKSKQKISKSPKGVIKRDKELRDVADGRDQKRRSSKKPKDLLVKESGVSEPQKTTNQEDKIRNLGLNPQSSKEDNNGKNPILADWFSKFQPDLSLQFVLSLKQSDKYYKKFDFFYRRTAFRTMTEYYKGLFK